MSVTRSKGEEKDASFWGFYHRSNSKEKIVPASPSLKMLAMTKALKGAYSCWYYSCFGVAALYMGTAIVTRRCAYVEWLGVNVYVKLCQLQTTHQSPTTGAGTDGDM